MFSLLHFKYRDLALFGSKAWPVVFFVDNSIDNCQTTNSLIAKPWANILYCMKISFACLCAKTLPYSYYCYHALVILYKHANKNADNDLQFQITSWQVNGVDGSGLPFNIS